VDSKREHRRGLRGRRKREKKTSNAGFRTRAGNCFEDERRLSRGVAAEVREQVLPEGPGVKEREERGGALGA